jgi:F-type H+-transporting ATPase subunit a
VSEVAKKKRTPVKRWIILAMIALGVYTAFIGPSILKPLSPTIILPAEEVGLNILGFPITNTIIATLLTDVLVLLLGFGALRFARSGKLVPDGIYNAFETIVEFLWNSVEGSAGKWAKRIFPIPATIFILVFVANMIRLVPGFEAIGGIKEAHVEGYAPVALFSLGSTTIYTLDKTQPVLHEGTEGEEAATGELETEVAASGVPCKACEIVPWLRGSSTDLNFTFALAIIAVVSTQVFGIWALGLPYLEKFFQVRQLISGGIFGIINFAVGFLEIILEFAKILSFGFRLFGNVFAGGLLLVIVGTLLPVALPAGLYLFEMFFGVIQAYVFFLLATVFISGATVSHHGSDHGEEHE